MKIVNKFRFFVFIGVLICLGIGVQQIFFKKKDTDTVKQNTTERTKPVATKDSTKVVDIKKVANPVSPATEEVKKEDIVTPKKEVPPPVVVVPIIPKKEEVPITKPGVKKPLAPNTITSTTKKKSSKNQTTVKKDSALEKKVLEIKF